MSFLSQLIYGEDGPPPIDDNDGGNEAGDTAEEKATNINGDGEDAPKKSEKKKSKKSKKDKAKREKKNSDKKDAIKEQPQSDEQMKEDEANAAVASLLGALYEPSSSIHAHNHVIAPTAELDSQASQPQEKLQPQAPYFENPLLPRKKRKHVPEIPIVISDDPNDDIKRELNQVKRHRILEWDGLRTKWKKRLVNWEDEVDVGGAIAYQARLVLAQKRKQQQILEQQKEKEDQLQLQIHDGDEDIVDQQQIIAVDEDHEKEPDERNMDDESISDPPLAAILDEHLEGGYSSDEGNDDVFDRLISMQNKEVAPEAVAAEIDRGKYQESIAKLKRTYHETLSYWELGIQAPKPDSLDFLYNRDSVVSPDSVTVSADFGATDNDRRKGGRKRTHFRKRMRLVEIPPKSNNAVGEEDNDDDEPELAVLRKYDNTNTEPDPNVFFQLPLNHSVNVHGTLVHHRQLIRMAARYIVGAAGRQQQQQQQYQIGKQQQDRLDDRLLRLIWQNPDHQRYRRLWSLLTLTEEQGSNMEAFLSHEWKSGRDRANVVKQLAVHGRPMANSQELYTPPGFIGRSLEKNLVITQAKVIRGRLVKKHSSKKWPTSMLKPPPVEGGEFQDEPLDGVTRALVKPAVGYVHTPGTIPPIPMFPMDETSLMFGPSDKHVTFRHTGYVDEATYTLTVSSLLNRLAELHAARGTGGSDSNGDIQKLQDQLTLFIEQAPLVTRNNLYKAYINHFPLTEVPLVQFYHVTMGFLSFTTSGIPQSSLVMDPTPITNQENGAEEDNNNGEYSSLYDRTTTADVLTMDKVADKIFNFCTELRTHNGLQAFPRIHVTFALAVIARILPPSAADILSKPMDDHKRRTPFDIFRLLLEHLEEQNMLVDDDKVPEWSSAADASVVRVGELEYALHQAAEIFNASCIQRDPVEISYHEWHLGALAASVLLCSGTSLGSEALPFPSAFYTKRLNDAEGDFFSARSSSQDVMLKQCTVRSTLPKFEDLRRSTKKALGLLVQLCRYQKGSMRGHLAISSFLEWKQAVALLAGHDCSKVRKLEEIRKIHLHHTSEWALQERSPKALKYAEAVTPEQDKHTDTRLRQLAAAVENDADNMDNWKELALALGPVGLLRSRIDSPCGLKRCMKCQLLTEGLAVDHERLKSRKRAGTWWGVDLFSWWYPHFLVLPFRLPVLIAKDIIKMRTSFEKRLAQSREEAKQDSNGVEDVGGEIVGGGELKVTKPSGAGEKGDEDWLWCTDHEKDENTDAPDYYDKFRDSGLPVDDDLPDLYEISSRLKSRRHSSSHSSATSALAELDSANVAVYCKLLVTCHLFGVTHPGVMEAVVELARRSTLAQTTGTTNEHCGSSGEYECLVQLSQQGGLDISSILKRYQKTLAPPKPSTTHGIKPISSLYSEAQREAMREGLLRFGKNFKGIRKHYDVLNDLTQTQLKSLFHFIVEHEGVDPNITEPTKSQC